MSGTKSAPANADVQKIANEFGQRVMDKFMLDRSWSDGSELNTCSLPGFEAAVGAAADMFFAKMKDNWGKKS